MWRKLHTVKFAGGKSGKTKEKATTLGRGRSFELPTLVNNVESLANIPYIVLNGGDKYASFGTEASGGTKLVCLSGNVVNRGVYEVRFGTTLREIIYELGGVFQWPKAKARSNWRFFRPCFDETLLDTPLCYDATWKNGITVGSGALLVVDDPNCVVDFVKCITEFFVLNPVVNVRSVVRGISNCLRL